MIGKTRQPSAKFIEVYDAEAGRARGTLGPPPSAGRFRHSRRSPSPDLVSWIDHYWMVSWDLRGLPPYAAETLPHPNFQVIFEKGRSAVSGVFTGKFSRILKGKSHVFGVKFAPGAFRPFLRKPAASLTDRTVPLARVFGEDVSRLEKILTGPAKEETMIAAANLFFGARIPAADEAVVRSGELVRLILQQTEIKTVDDLARRTGIGKRTLQRMFNEYVGVSPKWVIRRYRLHELIERFKSGKKMEWSDLALELGYFDQAHLINDFRSMVGYSPVQYEKASDVGP